ncbi:MAG: T9SS type A sorting domain-containing protein [Bacteroidetes bacterium]|nr:T9SS type A sorting domain-containing protein [Bacteroidota bacterium]
MRKTNFIFSTVLSSCLISMTAYGQSSCTDWENEYVQNKDNNLGANTYDFLGPGDQVAQTYHYSGQGSINAIRLHGYVPGMFSTWVPLRIRIYNVDANNRPTTPISSYIYATYYDSPSNSNVIDIPTTYVDGNFAVSVQVYDFFRTFNCLTNEPGDGNGEDLASYRNDFSSGSWGSTLDDLDDVDYYIEPLMSHTNNASFDIVDGNCHDAGPVSFENASVVSEDAMFNQSATIYTWNFGDATSSNLENPTHTYSAGAYTVTLTTTHEYFDGSTCTDVYSQQISVGMSVAANVTDASCFGDEDGSVSPTVTNGTAPFSFWTSAGDGLSGLAAGNYVLYAEDDLGCIASSAFTVDENPEMIFGSPAVTSATCGNADGAILVVASGGTGTIEYSMDGGLSYQSTGYFNALEGGIVTITVQDQSSDGCTASMNFIIPETSSPNISLFSTTNVTCNNDLDGEIVVVANGGTGALGFSIDGGDNFQSSGTFSGLSAGEYSIIVQDGVGCTNGIGEITITEPDAIAFDVESEPVLCFGGSNGSIQVSNVIGGTGTFQYSINGSTYQSGSTFTGLSAGSYTVYARDVKGCEETQNVTVVQPTILTASATHVNPTCYGEASGSITVTAAGGVGNYSYDITSDGNEAQHFNTFYGIGDGTYNIIVSDGNGCLVNTSATVTEPTEVSATLVVGSSTCGGSDGSIGITAAAGGTGSGYQFSANDGATWNTIPGNVTGLAAGAYDILIRDGAGCTIGYQSTVTNIGSTPVLTVLNHTDVTCNGGNNGSITVGTGVATDQYSIGSGFQSSGVFTGLPAGTYDVIVKDVANCQLEATTVTIIEPAAFVIITTENDVTCFEGTDGSVDILASGGAGTISYSLDGITFQSSNSISGLTAGEYDLTILDAVGCYGYSSFVIEQPTEIKAYVSHLDVTCNGADNGVIYASASGGTPTYMYSLNNITFGASGTFTSLGGGLHTVYVQDAQGCQVEKNVYLAEPTAIVLNATVSDVSCAGGDNGVIDLSVTGGIAPYSYQWITAEVIHYTEDVFNLGEGTYSVTVMDANGCTENASYTVNAPSNPVVVNGAVTDASGASANDGSIDVTVTGGTPPYFYDWSNGSTSGDISGLAPGAYTVEVTDGAGCSVSSTFTVTYELGLNEGDNAYTISVYPNPARDVLNITVADANVTLISLMNIQGKVVYTDASGEKNVQLGLEDFAGGIYFVNIQTDKGISTEKIVITK